MMKQIKYPYVIIFLLPFGYTFELANLDKIDADSPPLKTREERSPHYSSGFFPGFNSFLFGGGHHGSHENHHGSHENHHGSHENHHGSHENHHGLDCPFPYIRVGENCFYAKCTNGTSDMLTWNAARIYCQTSIPGGGDLAVVDSANEFADAVRYIRSLDPNKAFVCDYWIGGYDTVNTVGATTENIWTWINGKRMSLGVPFWDQVIGSMPPALLPTISTTVQQAYLRENGNYFFNQADGTIATYFPLCQISLETRHSGHGGHSHEDQHFGFFNNFQPEWRSDQQDAIYPQLREINPFQNSHFRSSQVAPNNPFVRSFGNNPPNHRHRMPYVMNSQQRNLPIPGMFSARKAAPNNLTQQSKINDENRDKQTPPERNNSLLDKKINFETKEETILQSATNNGKFINDQQAAVGLMQERAKESKSEIMEVQKEVSTEDNDTEMLLERKIAADDIMNENEPDVNANIEVDEPGMQVKEELAEISLPVNEQKVKSNEQEEAVTHIPVNEVELINQDTDILIDDQTEELHKQNVQMKTSSADTDKANGNFNHVTKLEIDNEQETSEGKRNEFQSDPLNSYLPGMIYDIVNILQNIDRNYKPRFNIDRTEAFSP